MSQSWQTHHPFDDQINLSRKAVSVGLVSKHNAAKSTRFSAFALSHGNMHKQICWWMIGLSKLSISKSLRDPGILEFYAPAMYQQAVT